MKIVEYISICLLSCALAGFHLPVKAQDNPYKIDNSLYQLYEKATKNRKIYNGMMKTYYYQFLGPRPPKKGSIKE